MLTPQITLTATLEDITGQPAGSTANPAKLVITLCAFGLTLPQIVNTATLAAIASFEVLSTGSEISVALWGNDVISPVNETYYCIVVMDGLGNVVQAAAYQFTGTQVIDLSNAVPYNPPPYPTPAKPTVIVFADTATGLPFTMYIANGAIQIVAGGNPLAAVAGIVLLDTGNSNAPVTIEITNGAMTVVLGGAGGVPFITFTDVLTYAVWRLVMISVGGIETPEVVAV